MAISVIGTTVSPLTDDLATRFKELPRMNNDRAIEKSRIANHLRASLPTTSFQRQGQRWRWSHHTELVA